MGEDQQNRFQKRQRIHVIASITWLIVASLFFVALIILAIEENYLVQEDAYVQALINLILALAAITWVATGVYIVQRKRSSFLDTAQPVAKYIVAAVICTACIGFVAFIILAYGAYGSYVQGEYYWAAYIIVTLVGLFLFGGAWHVARLVKPDFIKRRQRPFTRKGGKVAYVALSIAVLVGACSLFSSLWMQASTKATPYTFTTESGTANTSVILLIGDGMGLPQVELGRLVEYGPAVNSSIDRFPYKTTVSTSNIDGGTTDSAAGGTAIATGVRTMNGRISMSWNDMNITTILEIAKGKGYATGLITICQLAHATPAVFAAHQPNRDAYPAIAKDMVDHGIDVILGGGRGDGYFGPHVDAMVASGYVYATNKTQLSSMNATPALGLFASGNLPRVQDYTSTTSTPTLLEMVEKGIDLLNSTGKPFFLMVEESAIDWGGHDNDPVYVAHEMIQLDKIVNYTINLATGNPKLQVLLTADHETGGLSINGHNFTTPPPSEGDTLDEKIVKRTSRANQVQVSWSTGGHTNDNVIFAGIGPYTSQLAHARYNIDVFSIMRMAIEGQSGPVVPGMNDGYRNVDVVVIAFWGMIGVSLAIAALYVRNVVKARKRK